MSSDLTTSDTSVTVFSRENNGIANTIIKVVKKLIFLFPVYLIGYFGFSVVWIYGIILLIIFDTKSKKRRQTKRNISRAIALGYEKEVVLNILKNLPSWINFPDVERVEWLNKTFKQLWEWMNQYIHDLIPHVIEPAIQSYVADFKFDKVVLGNVPLRIDSVRVYDQVARNKIIMDLDVSYAGDCYVTFQTFKFTGGIKNIQLHGKLRVVMTPLISKLPIIGGLQVYFMNQPDIDFDLIKVTQILDMPLIRNKIKNTTMNIINSMFLFPNFYSVRLSDGVNMSKLAIFRPEGILRIHIVEAKDLVNKDIIGKSDPYTVLSIGSIKIETPIIQNSLNPKWDFWCEFELESNSELKIEVWDHDDGSKDETLGDATIEISQIVKKGEDDMWVKLENVNKGIIHIRATCLSLSTNYEDLPEIINETKTLSQGLHTALFVIYLESSQNLPKISDLPPKPYILLEIENVSKETDIEETCDPIWEKGFTFMIRDPEKAVLDVKIIDHDTKHKIGDFSYKLNNIKNEPKMEFRHHQFFLNGPNSQSSLTCSMMLRIFKNENITKAEELDEIGDEIPRSPTRILEKQESFASNKSRLSQRSIIDDNEIAFSRELSINEQIIPELISTSENSGLGNIKLSLFYSMQRQKLIVTVHEVEDIPHKNSSHFPDAYVKLYLITNKSKSAKKKTKIIKDNCNPVFNETFEYLISSGDLAITRLTITVETNKNIFNLRSKFLGQVFIDLGQYNNLNETLTHWFNLKPKDDTHVYYLSN